MESFHWIVFFVWQDTLTVGTFVIWTCDLGSQVKKQGKKWEKYATRISTKPIKTISQILCML